MLRRTDRPGYTLLELLVVIAIMAVLIGLLAAVLGSARSVARDLDCYNDLAQLDIAVSLFTQSSNPSLDRPGFLPSEFDPSGGDVASQSFILKMFPNSGGKLKLPAAKLQGDEALVLLLGGPNQQGWSSNGRDPATAHQPGVEQILPFYTFKANRLVDPDGNGYPSYCDTFGEPIAYFSTWHWNNNRWAQTGYGPDCPRLGVQPYANESRYSWQLISAGSNRRFGQAGAVWTPGAGPTVYPPKSDGADDLANFTFRLGRTR